MSIHNITFCVPYRGVPVLLGNYDTPAGVMPRGIGVVNSSDTVAKAAKGSVPVGFLNSEVTTDGPSYEELIHIGQDSLIKNEKKVSEGKVQVVAYDPGTFYVLKGNVLAGVTFAVDEQLLIAVDGEFSDLNGAAVGNTILGIVVAIDATFMNEVDCIVWQAISNLGTKV